MIEKVRCQWILAIFAVMRLKSRTRFLRGRRRLKCRPACADGRASIVEFSNTISENRDNDDRFRTTPARYLLDKVGLQPGLRSKLQ